jgi:hypothetical protein
MMFGLVLGLFLPHLWFTSPSMSAQRNFAVVLLAQKNLTVMKSSSMTFTFYSWNKHSEGGIYLLF